MSEFKTSQGRPVLHCHIQPCFDRELNATEVAQIRTVLRQQFPNVAEVAPPTRNYNCHGHAHARSHGWFNDPRLFIADDYFQSTMAQPRIGDVIVYVKDGMHTHSAVVNLVSGTTITQLRSKWGQFPEVLHGLREVPGAYGEPIYLLRRRAGILLAELEGNEEMIKQAIQEAIGKFSNPDVYYMVMLASSPETAREIIATLPGVADLIEIGRVAVPEILNFFEQEETQANDILAGIALYLLQRIPMSEALEPVANFLATQELTMITAEMAPAAFLTIAGIEVIDENPLSVALREALKYAKRQPPKE
jgi:hypothetical protein